MMIRAMTVIFVAAALGLLVSAAIAGPFLEAGCPDGLCSCDQNLDGDVQINELIGGVNNLLQGCDTEGAACVDVRTTSTRVSATEDALVPLDGEPVRLAFNREVWDTADNFDDPPMEGSMGVTIPEGQDGIYLLHANLRWKFSNPEGSAAGPFAPTMVFLRSTIYRNEEIATVTDDQVTNLFPFPPPSTGASFIVRFDEFNHVATVTELLKAGDVVSVRVSGRILDAEGTAAQVPFFFDASPTLTVTKAAGVS